MSGLDPIGRKDVRDLILSLRDEGKTVFFSSHILEDAEVICDQVAIILNGKIVTQGYLDALLGQELVGAELVVEGIDEELHRVLVSAARRAVVQGHRFLFEFGDESWRKRRSTACASGGACAALPKRRSLEDLLLEGLRRGEAMRLLWRIWVLASNTYREAVRDKLLYNLLLFAALMIAS
jgi:ABC-2 type transport system ATP-binding protein